MKAVVLGAGAWGTALAVTLAHNGADTTLAVRRPDHLRQIVQMRQNATYLPGVALPQSLRLTDHWNSALSGADVIVMAVPSRFARAVMAPLRDSIPAGAIMVSVTKGIERESLMTMSRMLAEVAPHARIAVLSGPGFAAEIARGKPAALVAGAEDETLARDLQSVFRTPTLRVYRSADVIGIEIGGAVKNVIAIAAGISDGLKLGSSARAALVTRGLAEITRLAVAAGARPETMAGLAGLGDLVLTCTGELSRNRAVGLRLANAEPINFEESGAPVAEGIANALSIRMLSMRLQVEMPIVSAVYRAIYESASAAAMVSELLSRGLKAEF
jgi:glycerol-3-phosphate dehydrogenase (NAD(P)+)